MLLEGNFNTPLLQLVERFVLVPANSHPREVVNIAGSRAARVLHLPLTTSQYDVTLLRKECLSANKLLHIHIEGHFRWAQIPPPSDFSTADR